MHALQTGNVLFWEGPGMLSMQTMPRREVRDEKMHRQAQHAVQSVQEGHLLPTGQDVRALYVMPGRERPEGGLHEV